MRRVDVENAQRRKLQKEGIEDAGSDNVNISNKEDKADR